MGKRSGDNVSHRKILGTNRASIEFKKKINKLSQSTLTGSMPLIVALIAERNAKQLGEAIAVDLVGCRP